MISVRPDRGSFPPWVNAAEIPLQRKRFFSAFHRFSGCFIRGREIKRMLWRNGRARLKLARTPQIYGGAYAHMLECAGTYHPPSPAQLARSWRYRAAPSDPQADPSAAMRVGRNENDACAFEGVLNSTKVGREDCASSTLEAKDCRIGDACRFSELAHADFQRRTRHSDLRCVDHERNSSKRDGISLTASPKFGRL